MGWEWREGWRGAVVQGRRQPPVFAVVLGAPSTRLPGPPGPGAHQNDTACAWVRPQKQIAAPETDSRREKNSREPIIVSRAFVGSGEGVGWGWGVGRGLGWGVWGLTWGCSQAAVSGCVPAPPPRPQPLSLLPFTPPRPAPPHPSPTPTLSSAKP
jgi:hypothetical protein